MELDNDAKEIVEKIAAAINRAVEDSRDVAESINQLRDTGFEMELTLRLEIGLRELEAGEPNDDVLDASELELTDEDRRIMRQMRIKLDDDDGKNIH